MDEVVGDDLKNKKHTLDIRFLMRPRTYWGDYTSHLSWECLWFTQEDLESGAREVQTDLLLLL